MNPDWSTLSDIERSCLRVLKTDLFQTELEVSQTANVSIDQARRALSWLESKQLAAVQEKKSTIIVLTKTGELAREKGLPEERVLQFLDQKGGSAELSIVQTETGLGKELFFVIGKLKPKNYLTLQKNGEKQILHSHYQDFKSNFDMEMKPKKEALNHVISGKKMDETIRSELLSRGLIEQKESTIRSYQLTSLGKQAVGELGNTKNQINELTSDLLQSKKWQNSSFRPFDVSSPVESRSIGKKQPYMAFLELIRQKLSEMGFTELDAPLITTEFYNFDALFQPQNHSARTIHDTYQLKDPKLGKLPSKKLVDAVKFAHEKGGKSGSTGWGYSWDEQIASRLMPLSHDTANTPRVIAKGVKFPGKYYTMARVFRPDVIDAKHLVEFNQLGGFVLDHDLHFRHLLGLLQEFALEVGGCEKVKFLPAYFPFTEPSVQVSAKHPTLGWVELGGAGMFRPEMMEALGYPKLQCPAWGMGLDRLAMFKMGTKDIRHLFSTDLSWLKNQPLVKL